MHRWISLGANLGVLIGIVLLIAELNQNRDMMRAQIRNEISRGVLDLLNLSAVSPELAHAIVRADQGEQLSPAEEFMVGSRSESVLRLWENIHYQYRQGLFERSEFDAAFTTMARILAQQPTLIEHWCRERGSYSKEFSQQVEQILPDGSC